MYLIDTSVWIGLFRGRESAAIRQLKIILNQGIPFGISSVIYQELLQGAKGENDYNQLQTYLGSQRFYHPLDEIKSYADAARIYVDCRRHGITIRSTIDCLIAEVAIEHGLILLHDDRDFTQMASVINDLRECSSI